MFPTTRLRRLRTSAALRTLVRENRVAPSDLLMPLFLVPGKGVRNPIRSMPGQFQLSINEAVHEAKRIYQLGIPGVLLFAIPESKDSVGSAAWDQDGVVQRAVRAIKESTPDLLVITDVCFCEYTDHGHCGVMCEGVLENDSTLPNLIKQAVSHARAGADILAPSGMLDGAVAALREGLDEAGFADRAVMAYSAKFSSSFYGPFREAVDSAPQYGDRKTYQMDPANINEALREVRADIEEGADVVMVKPALAFMDVIRRVKDEFQMPTACYNVSGEYAMIKAAALNGWIDGTRCMLETLTSLKRAGSDIIITYFATEFAELWHKGNAEL